MDKNHSQVLLSEKYMKNIIVLTDINHKSDSRSFYKLLSKLEITIWDIIVGDKVLMILQI